MHRGGFKIHKVESKHLLIHKWGTDFNSSKCTFCVLSETLLPSSWNWQALSVLCICTALRVESECKNSCRQTVFLNVCHFYYRNMTGKKKQIRQKERNRVGYGGRQRWREDKRCGETAGEKDAGRRGRTPDAMGGTLEHHIIWDESTSRLSVQPSHPHLAQGFLPLAQGEITLQLQVACSTLRR